MICPKCDTRMDVTHVYPVNKVYETRNLKCPKCSHIESSITVIASRVDFPGAQKLKRLIESQQVRVTVDLVPRLGDLLRELRKK